ncbi:CRISPR-associated helicase/endonuclease Cas3 [Methylosoma difficile]
MFKPKNPQQAPQRPTSALPLDECLAKSYGQKQPGRKILNHCHIVGEVAKALLYRMPNWLILELFPSGSELIAACHDLGKVSPTFQEKIYRGTEHYQNNSKPELSNANPEIEKLWGGHAGVSQATAQALNAGRYIPEILGQHHGYSPDLGIRKADYDEFGGKAWQERRSELLAGLKHLLNCDFPIVSSELQAKALAGLTTVSDWIGSGSLFDDPSHDWQPNIDKALDNAGFVQPSLKPDLSFFDLFGFEPRAIQQQLISSTKTPGVYVLEAPMGIGKTEAALYAAYQLMVSQQATGLYFALPTQLTSDKIHERVTQFLTKILTADSPHQKALLLHGNAWLKQTELGVEGNPNGSWFESGKRGILAPFAVGTIDQALMAVMNVKHGFVRAFGLAGKVVILDEVHSYDAYTGTLLDELVTALQSLQCTVIILSATLTQARRSALLGQAVSANAYPLISARAKQGELLELPVSRPSSRQVAIHCCQADELAFEAALSRAEQGQQILWIENTVAEAQEVYRRLSALDMPIECGLLHSRFLKTDRADKEKKWVYLYGKGEKNHQARQTQGRILVGTQLLEQSLDIDADFLISRFAPTDMLLQRLGRLWRHHDTPRPESAQCEAWLLTPEFNAAVADAKTQFGKTAHVYSPYVLCRSLEVWQAQTSITLPDDIRRLIEATYAERQEQGPMRAYLAELEKVRDKLKQLALVGLSKAGKTLSENKASTRYSDQDSVQVLLLKNYRHTADKSATEITLLDGEKHWLPRNLKIYDKPKWRELAATLLQNTVQVAEYLAPLPTNKDNLKWLEDYIYLGKQDNGESLLRIALVDEADHLKSLSGGQALPNYQLTYNLDFGYHAEKT